MENKQLIKRIKGDSYADGYGVGLEDGADMERQEIIDKIKICKGANTEDNMIPLSDRLAKNDMCDEIIKTLSKK